MFLLFIFVYFEFIEVIFDIFMLWWILGFEIFCGGVVLVRVMFVGIGCVRRFVIFFTLCLGLSDNTLLSISQSTLYS